MQMDNSPKLCTNCGRPVKGRTDKRFCDDSCRNNFNNSQKAAVNNHVRNINNVLGKNRRILEQLLGVEEMKKQPKEKLDQEGFNFKYHTHTYTNKQGNIYYFCYEFGFLPLENNWFLLVKRKEE